MRYKWDFYFHITIKYLLDFLTLHFPEILLPRHSCLLACKAMHVPVKHLESDNGHT